MLAKFIDGNSCATQANEELLAAFDDLSNAMAPSDPARAIVVAAEVESKAIAEVTHFNS